MAKGREEQDRMEKDAIAVSGTREENLPERRRPGRPPTPKVEPWTCPQCGGTETKVLSTRRGTSPYAFRIRVRVCVKCGKRFTTREGLDPIGRMMEGPPREP